eukprot:15474638-Alexandrium_andersonii.AAC.1
MLLELAPPKVPKSGGSVLAPPAQSLRGVPRGGAELDLVPARLVPSPGGEVRGSGTPCRLQGLVAS